MPFGMYSWALDIIKDAVKGQATKALEETMWGKPGEAVVTLQNLTDQLNNLASRLETALATLMKKEKYQAIASKINSYTDEIKLKLAGSEAARRKYMNELSEQAGHPGGVTFLLNYLHDILVQADEQNFPDGYIGMTFNKLEDLMVKDDDNRSLNKSVDGRTIFTIEWYLANCMTFMATMFTMQMRGLAIQIFMAGDDGAEIARRKAAMQGKLNEQLAFAYKRLHPCVARMKTSFLDPIDRTKWWQIVEESGKVLTRDQNGSTVKLESEPPFERNIWRFSSPPDVTAATSIIVRETQFPMQVSWRGWGSHDNWDYSKIYSTSIVCGDKTPGIEGNGDRIMNFCVLQVAMKPVKNRWLKETGEVDRTRNGNQASFRLVVVEDPYPYRTRNAGLRSLREHWMLNQVYHLEDSNIGSFPNWNGLSTWQAPYEGKLVSCDNEIEVYYGLEGTLRHIVSGDVAFQLFGANWGAQVTKLPWLTLLGLLKGPPLPDAKLITGVGGGIHIIDNGFRRHIVEWQYMRQCGFDGGQVRDAGDLKSIPEGPVLSEGPARSLEGKRLQSSDTRAVYLVLDGALRQLTSIATINNLFGNNPGIETRPQAEIDRMPKGSPLPNDSCLRTIDGVLYLYDTGRNRWIPNAEAVHKYGFAGDKIDKHGIWGLKAERTAYAFPVGEIKMEALEGKRYKGDDSSGRTYLALDKSLRHIPDHDTYHRLFGGNGDILILAQSLIDSMPKGPPLNEAGLFREDNGKVSLLDQGKARWLQSGEVVNRYGFDWNQIKGAVSDARTGRPPPEGPTISP